jgi:hypothetical protein
MNTTETLSHDKRYLRRDAKDGLVEDKSVTLPLHQSTRSLQYVSGQTGNLMSISNK